MDLRKYINRGIMTIDSLGKTFYNFGLYGEYGDELDQPLCKLAKANGIDVIVFTWVPGTEQISGEVLDTRNRAESFRHLVYPG